MAAELSEPLVSVVTATHGRPRTILERCVPSVACQTYGSIEHLIVFDGPDEHGTVQALVREHGYSTDGIDGPTVNTPRARRIVELGRNWTRPFGNESNGAIARAVGGWLACGEFVHWLDDDNIWDPQHVAEMVRHAQASKADLICSDFTSPGGLLGVWDQPRTGCVDASSFMVRTEALRHSSWLPDGYTCDGQLAERLVAAGVQWTRKPGATMHITSQRFGAPD